MLYYIITRWAMIQGAPDKVDLVLLVEPTVEAIY